MTYISYVSNAVMFIELCWGAKAHIWNGDVQLCLYRERRGPRSQNFGWRPGWSHFSYTKNAGAQL